MATMYPLMSWKQVARAASEYDEAGDISAQYVQQVMRNAGYYKRRVALKDKEGNEYQAWETAKVEKI